MSVKRAGNAAGKTSRIAVHYTVTMPDPASHNFEVTVRVSGMERDSLVLAFPAWTPGSYKIRDFARNVTGFSARDTRGTLESEQLDKQRFRIECGRSTIIKATYSYYADEFSVRTAHLDDTHGFFLGTNLCPYLEDENSLPLACEYRITIRPHRGWRVATSLPAARGAKNTWVAANYDLFGDTPFEIGTHTARSFMARGVRHDVVFYGWGNFDEKRIVEDTRKIVERQARNFGGLPYKNYLFIHQMTPDAGGGLEHLNSCVCAWPSWKFKDEEDYQAFIRLVSHEFFHVWNVKRIRPEILGPFDYSKEQHTKALWVMEGMTQYYERLWCVRAGVTPEATLLRVLGELFDREDNRPGRKVMSLENSSWLAWTKLYQADEGFLNTGVSYYSRGAQIGFLLDARIRKLTRGRRSLDDVMRLAFKRYGWPKPGFPEGGFEELCEEVAGGKLTRFWRDHVKGTRELDYREALDVYGLKFERDKEGFEPWLGLVTGTKGASFQIRGVHADGPGAEAGLQPRDEIVALDGNRVNSKTFDKRVAELKSGKQAELTVFRRERLLQVEIRVGRKPAGKQRLVRVKKLTAAQRSNYKKWMS